MILDPHAPSPVTTDLIKDGNLKTFMADVIEASHTQPVLVDFWAPWCGPCKQLTPVLEKLVKQAAGKIRLVKVNVDENQQIASQLQVKSIPAVYAFVDGQPIDAFMGALPESQVKQFIDKLGGKGSLAEKIAAAVKLAEEAISKGAYDEALDILSQILAADPQNSAALATVVLCHIAQGDLEAAQAAWATVPADKHKVPELVQAKAALDLALNPVDLSALAELKTAVEKNPEDYDKRLELALALNGTGERIAAADQLLYIFKKQRDWKEDAARQQLVQFFEAWGPMDAATLNARRKLSSLMFA